MRVVFALVASGTIAVLSASACGSGDGAANGGAKQSAQGAQATSSNEEARLTSAWLTEEQLRVWQEQHDDDGIWVVGMFLRPGSECTKDGSDDLIRRFRLISKEAHALSQERLLAEAFASLEGAHPAELSNPLVAVRLKLLDARVEGETLYLDLGRAIYATNNTGTCGGSAMADQLVAVARHYFPSAADVCVLVNGTPSGRGGEALLFHDSIGCPLALDT